MRIPSPHLSDLVVQPFAAFPDGALVWLPPSSAKPQQPIPAVKVTVAISGGQSGVFLFDAYAEGSSTMKRGDFMFLEGHPSAFQGDMAGLASKPVLELHDLGKASRPQPWTKTVGELALRSAGPVIATFTPGNVAGLLDPGAWAISVSQAAGGSVALVVPTWQLVWTTVSGAEVVQVF